MPTVISMENVVKRYGEQLAVNQLSFQLERGQILGLLGPNGSGKTTTIRLLNGVINPDGGNLRILGMDPQTQGGKIRAKSGVLTESAGLYEGMGAKQNLAFFAALYGLSDVEKRIDELLDDFGLSEANTKSVGAFSTGMKKRLGIARALLHKPEILYLDEPTSGLDPEGSRDLMRYIRDLNKQYGVTILICTHLLKQVQDLCHRFVFIDRGSLLEEGTLEELEERHLGQVYVEVETPLVLSGGTYKRYPVTGRKPNYLVFQLGDKEQIGNLLRSILEDAPVYGVNILGRDLEALYFKIRGDKDE